MAVTLSQVRGFSTDDVRGARFTLRDVAFTGNYQDDGSESTVTAPDVGMQRILAAIPQGMAPATNLATANEVAAVVADDNESVEFAFYENAAAGSPSAEKTDNEAFLAGQTVRVLFIGY